MTTGPVKSQPFTTLSPTSQAIAQQPENIRAANDTFTAVDRPYALLITNHGYAGPTFPAGAPDSGGQITYVNHVAKLLAAQGFRVTIASRSFNPDEQFASFGNRKGVAFMEGEPFVRYVFVPDTVTNFIPKEQIYDVLPTIASNLADFVAEEAQAAGKKPWEFVSWINTHYVDAGTIGQLIIKRWMDEAGSTDPKLNKHAWTPHSLGKLKEQNMLAMRDELKATDDFKARFTAMNFKTREAYERMLIGSAKETPAPLQGCPAAVALVTTSAEITETFGKLDRSSDKPIINFPPGTDVTFYTPRKSTNDPEIKQLFTFMKDIMPGDLLADASSNPQNYNVVVEAGRMDATKRKEIPIGAMKHLPENTLLFITGKKDKVGIYDGLAKEIADMGLEKRVFLLGMVPDELMGPLMSLPHGTNSDQFRLAIAVSASRMEGWGMAAMDMTAGGMPLVSSPLVPYATHIKGQDDNAVIIVPLSDDEPAAYAQAFKQLIDDPDRARTIAQKGHELVQAFDWRALVKRFAEDLGKMFG